VQGRKFSTSFFRLGEGGFAKTYHAIIKYDDLAFYLKEIPSRDLSENKFKDFQKEVKILS
jgi:hypothetical protein